MKRRRFSTGLERRLRRGFALLAEHQGDRHELCQPEYDPRAPQCCWPSSWFALEEDARSVA